MAKNYSISEAVEIIVEGKDLESIADLGKRFPILTAKIAAIGALAGDSFVEFMGYMPEHVTANKVNTIIKNGVQESSDEGDEEEVEEKPATTNKEIKTEAVTDDSDYASKSSNALYQILKERGLTKGHKFSKKADMIAALEEYDKKNGKKAAVKEEEDEEEATSEYEGKSAQELFKECKKRGIKVEVKKPVKYYIEKLKADDAANATEEEDEDWGDEEEVEEKPAKSDKKKPVAKKKDEDEDDDDEWDI